MSETPKALTAFFIVVTPEGGFQISLEQPKETIEVERQATTADVYQICQQVVKELDNQVLTDRVVATLAQALGPILEALTPPPVETIPDKIAAKLKERQAEASAPEETPAE